MGQITSLFVRKVLGVADECIDKSKVLRGLGLDPDGPADPSVMLTDTDYYTFFEELAKLDPIGITLPLRAGAAMRCDDYGAFGLAWKSALNLRGSYQRAERYARVMTSVSTYEVEPVDQGAFMHLHRAGDRRLGLRLSNEATIASVFSISQQVSSKAFKPLAVYFKHSAPESTINHEAYFGCPVHFDSDRNALLVSTDMLQTANKLGDESISRFFDTQLEAELSKLADESALHSRVRIHISRTLSEGVPTITEVAKCLGMSGRTLQRKLSEQGYTFQSLVDESRRQLAERLLQQTDYSLAEVAFLTGFSEQSAFTRAFKRWAGQTPRSFRIEIQSR